MCSSDLGLAANQIGIEAEKAALDRGVGSQYPAAAGVPELKKEASRFVKAMRLGQGSPSQPPSGLAPSVPRAGTPRSRSEERRQVEGVLDPVPLGRGDGGDSGGSVRTACPPRAGARAGRTGGRSLGRCDDAWAGRSFGASGVRGGNGAKAGSGATLGSACGDWGPRGLPAGTIGLAPERVSI